MPKSSQQSVLHVVEREDFERLLGAGVDRVDARGLHAASGSRAGTTGASSRTNAASKKLAPFWAGSGSSSSMLTWATLRPPGLGRGHGADRRAATVANSRLIATKRVTSAMSNDKSAGTRYPPRAYSRSPGCGSRPRRPRQRSASVTRFEARAPDFRPGREIVEPAPAGAAAPAIHGFRLASPDTEVVTSCRGRARRPGCRRGSGSRPGRASSRSRSCSCSAPRLVVSLEPALDGGSSREQHLVGHLDVRDLVGLRVVERLVEACRGPGRADRGERWAKKRRSKGAAPLMDDPVVEAILEPQLAPGEPVELRVADERLRGRWQGEPRSVVSSTAASSKPTSTIRTGSRSRGSRTRPGRGGSEGVGRPGAPGRRGHRRQAQQREETRPTANEAYASRPGHVPPSRRSER